MKNFFPIFNTCYPERLQIGYIVGTDWVNI